MTSRTFNIVFDLGGVVLEWRPDALVAEVFEHREDRIKARRQIIGHPDWLELDRGTLDVQQAIERAANRTGLAQADVRKLMQRLPPSLKPIHQTIELMTSLKADGHRLYCLSNMHLASIAYLQKHCAFWPLFEGVVISSQVKLIKPEPAIYRLLLETYDLDPKETIFIDDVRENLEAATAVGIQTLHFTNTNDCRRKLREQFSI